MSICFENLEQLNQNLQGQSPEQIVSWALKQAKNAVITTNFRPYEAAILHLVTRIKPDITVLFVDGGYATHKTYKHAQKIIKDLNLNVLTYTPKYTRGWLDAYFDGIPDVDSAEHDLFSNAVKLEPFTRAFADIKPDVWFTAIRRSQTAFRQDLGVLSLSKDGVLKVAPFFYNTDDDLDAYLAAHHLPSTNEYGESDYYDPTKVGAHRECGLHTKL